MAGDDEGNQRLGRLAGELDGHGRGAGVDRDEHGVRAERAAIDEELALVPEHRPARGDKVATRSAPSAEERELASAGADKELRDRRVGAEEEVPAQRHGGRHPRSRGAAVNPPPSPGSGQQAT
ncbi:MAG: hypothetical protein IT372_11200 [Polyangiaceae bacterium]|nr:hypothetical protein [Polyangiaceae bacterium]